MALASDDPREAAAARIVEAARLDQLILANARAIALADPKAEQQLDDVLHRVRPAALWNAQHPAWAPARAALREQVARESNEWIAQFFETRGRKSLLRELASGYRREYLAELADFAASLGGQAYFGRRVAEARAKAGESMFSLEPAIPATLEKLAADARRRFDALAPEERKRVKAFAEDPACTDCGTRTNAQFLDIYVNAQSKWLASVMVIHMGDVPYQRSDRWIAELNTRFAAQLPTESAKQVLGSLAMDAGGALTFRFSFYWQKVDGGSLALEIPRAHPAYAETLALAPGLAVGQSRVLYRDRNGAISDKP